MHACSSVNIARGSATVKSATPLKIYSRNDFIAFCHTIRCGYALLQSVHNYLLLAINVFFSKRLVYISLKVSETILCFQNFLSPADSVAVSETHETRCRCILPAT